MDLHTGHNYRYSGPLVCVEKWLQDSSTIPKDEDTEVPPTKWHSIYNEPTCILLYILSISITYNTNPM